MNEINHEICWNELITTDVKKSVEFYSKLFHWTHKEIECGGMAYTIFKTHKKEVAGLMKKPPQAECNCDKGPMWIPYTFVENVDKSAAKAKELGAKILLEPKDIPDVGRIAIIEDPCGAIMGLYTGEM